MKCYSAGIQGQGLQGLQGLFRKSEIQRGIEWKQ